MASNVYDQATGNPASGLETPKRALTIGAHPDDAEFGAGGTLARWADDGCHITMLVVTDGSKGTWDPDMDQTKLINQRQGEQRLAADVLGASEIVMLDHIDGELKQSDALVAELCWWIRETTPEVVLSHDPWKRYMLHPDHRATGMSAIDAIVAARDHLFYPQQGLAKHRPEAILLWAADEPDHFEDINTTFDRKLEALLCHSTQGPTTMGDATAADSAVFKQKMWDWAVSQGGSGTPVEAFKRLTP